MTCSAQLPLRKMDNRQSKLRAEVALLPAGLRKAPTVVAALRPQTNDLHAHAGTAHCRSAVVVGIPVMRIGGLDCRHASP